MNYSKREVESPDSSPTSQYLNSSTTGVDPVTKAVVDNILGKLPMKKEKVTLKCIICNLEFPSQIPLDMHLRGSKHNKRVRSQEIMKALEEEGLYAETESPDLRCDICNVVSNSSQQLQMHLKGTKHLNKSKALAAKDGTDTNSTPTAGVKRPASVALKDGSGAPPAKAVAVAKRCHTCNISLNSESQYQQHMDSKKHQNKVAGIKPPPKKWNNRPKPGYGYQPPPGDDGNYHNRKSLLSNLPPLSESFNMNNRGYNNNNDDYYDNGDCGLRNEPDMW